MKFFIGIWETKHIRFVPYRFIFSYRRLKNIHHPLAVGTKEWILDSGGFSELLRKGTYTYSPQEYFNKVLVLRPNLWCSMDWMCEPDIRKITGKTIKEHLELTTNNHNILKNLAEHNGIESSLMGIIQGYETSDYLAHIDMLKDAGLIGEYMGIGTLCRRSRKDEIIKIIETIKKALPSWVKLHGFGLKTTALRKPLLYDLLYSCDSMAWSYAGSRTLKPKKGNLCIINKNTICFSNAKNCAHCQIFMVYWAQAIEKHMEEAQKQKTLSFHGEKLVVKD
jgi:hypothetical protein